MSVTRASRRRFSARRGATRTLIATSATAGALLVFAASALAGPIALDPPGNGNPPLTAYDGGTSTGYVAWTAEPTNAGIDLCVLPPGASACEGGGPVLLTDPQYTGSDTPTLSGLRVMPNGQVVVLGVAGNAGTVAWASGPGGGFFAADGGLQNAGQTMSAINTYYEPDDVVPVSDTELATLDIQHNGFGVSPYDASGTNAGSSPRATTTTPAPRLSRPAVPASRPPVSA
jgi:hypothetical protein